MTETTYDRRAFMAYFSSIGLGSTLLPGVLWAQVQQQQQGPAITKEMIAAAEQIAGVEFSDEERDGDGARPPADARQPSSSCTRNRST